MFKRLYLLISIFAFVVMMGGCALSPEGNFVKNAIPKSQWVELATTATAQLEASFPPAKTEFLIKQKVQDPFGRSLINNLRQQGFGVWESAENEHSQAAAQNTSLQYLVDCVPKNEWCWVSIRAGKEQLARIFTLNQQGQLEMQGIWSVGKV